VLCVRELVTDQFGAICATLANSDQTPCACLLMALPSRPMPHLTGGARKRGGPDKGPPEHRAGETSCADLERRAVRAARQGGRLLFAFDADRVGGLAVHRVVADL
jgi:hypothetical protein